MTACQIVSAILMITTTTKAIIRGNIPTIANLVIRKENGESLAAAISRVARKINSVTTAAMLNMVLIPRTAIVVTVVTVVIVVTIASLNYSDVNKWRYYCQLMLMYSSTAQVLE